MVNSPRVCAQARSAYIETQSSPNNGRYVSAYAVTIRNPGRAPVQPLERYWLITNDNGRETEVRGEGVAGVQSPIAPGEGHQYTSGTIVGTPLGTIRGHYEMIDKNDIPFSIDVPVFRLVIPTLIHQKNMATYLIGNAHGCYDELIALLHEVELIPRKGTLRLTDDLIARGPGSLDVLRYVKSLGDSVRLVLDDHDLHLLVVFAGISHSKPKGHLIPPLGAPGTDKLLSWLRRQPSLQIDEERKLVTAHTRITPQRDLRIAKKYARDVEAVLSSDSYPFLPDTMYGGMPNS